jgi:hypothetical protein
MNTVDAQEIARGLSAIAARREDPATEKVAAVTASLQPKTAAIDLQQALSNPYLQNAALGAGAGGLIGLLQGKKKRRAALDYALMGGLGGLGATAAKNFLLTPATPPPAIAAAKHDGNTGNALFNLGAAGVGGYGGRQVANSLDAYGKLDRFLESGDPLAKQLKPTIDQLRANNGPSKITKNLSQHVRNTADASDPSVMGQMLGVLRGSEHMPRDVSMPLEAAGMKTPASVGGRVHVGEQAARGNFLGGILGRNSDEAADVLSAIASEPASGVGAAGRRLTGPQLRQAFRKLPRVGGRWAGVGLPVAGALALPALLNSFGGGSSAGE